MPFRMPVKRQVSSLPRHVTGDWGDLDDEDRQANDAALINGSRILSAYTTRKGDEDLDHHRGSERSRSPLLVVRASPRGLLNQQPVPSRLKPTPSRAM